MKDTLDIRRFFGLDDSTPLPTAVFSDMRNSTDDAPQGKQFLLQTFLASESPGKGKKGSDAAVAEPVALTADVLTKFARAGLAGDIGGSKGTKKSKGKKKSSKTAKKNAVGRTGALSEVMWEGERSPSCWYFRSP